MINIRYECQHCMKEAVTQLDITGDDVYQYEMLEGVVCSHCKNKNTVEVSISINVEVVTEEEDECQP